ncbi:nucleoporin Nup120/160-domain-containing protein [Mucidula mucida]|nr:nucleoporin Nup120/160-domain-containing protein [Mucidula mucida]
MEGEILVAAQLSSLYVPTQAHHVQVPTAKATDFPVSADPNFPAEHAVYSTVLQSTQTGTFLLRVLHEGLILELISLSMDILPIRFVLQSPVQSAPALTHAGSLHRLIIPLRENQDLWKNELSNISTREYLVKAYADGVKGVVYVHGTHCVAVGLENGALLRLDTEYSGATGSTDIWTETMFHPGSFLSSFTSFLSTTPSEGAEIVALASHPWPTDVGSVWSLSRDRVLRYWKPKVGCVASKVLSLSPGREATPSPSSSTNGVKPQVLLYPGPQSLLRVFTNSGDDDRIYVLVFIPTPSLTTSGGNFYLMVAVGDHLHEIGYLPTSTRTAYCHLQDFMILGDTLFTLWDGQGQSTIEKTLLRFDDSSVDAPIWKIEVLLSSGSLANKFFEVIMRPGMFSPLTLRLAVESYTTACLNSPGPHPPQLSAAYATIGEHIAAIVGCTTVLHPQYWNALKRDWEGFIARCREIERSSRGPLAAIVTEDLPIHLYTALSLDHALPAPPYGLFGLLWANCLVDILHQDLAFALADIIHDLATRSNFRDNLDAEAMQDITQRLSELPDLPNVMKTALDVIGGLEVVKAEREEETLATISAPRSEWWRAITADYAIVTANARYELGFGLVILLFFLADDLKQWNPALLAEIFAVFRGVAVMRFVVRQQAHHTAQSGTQDVSASEDVVSLMENMHVTRTPGQLGEPSSLVHRLVHFYAHNKHDVCVAAHEFWDSAGWLQGISPSFAAKLEVSFCEKLRQLGYFQTARDILAWLPRTPAVNYVLGRLYINIGRADDATFLFEKLAGSLGPDQQLSADDRMALTAVLTDVDLTDDPFFFYLHAAALFRTKTLTYQETVFTELAISIAPAEYDPTALWATVIKGYTDLGLYDDAYTAWTVCPSEKQKRESASHLVYQMCEGNAAQTLMTYNFSGFADEVEDCLAFKVRNADPRARPNYSRILYGWYTNRGDHKNAALTMYQRARKLRHLISSTSEVSLVKETCEAYLIALNSLSLADPKTAWMILPGAVDSEHEPRKRQKLRKIPEDRYTPGRFENEVVHIEDIQYEYALLTAQVDIHIRHQSSEFPLPPSSIVLRLTELNCFDRALSTARSLKVDMADTFTRLTMQCLHLSREPDFVLYVARGSSWSGTMADKAWRYLRQSLAFHDGPETDYRYSRTVLETIMQHQKAPPPPWLISVLEVHHHEFLIRINLRYGNFGQAIEHTLSMIHKEEARLARDPPKNAGSTWLPYATIDQVLIAAAEQDVVDPQLAQLRTEISARMKRVEKLSNFTR